VQRVINELAAAKLLDMYELSYVAHFALETLPVALAIECLEIFRVGGGNPSKRVCQEAKQLRNRNNLFTPDEPEIYRTRVKTPVCNGSAAVSAPVVSAPVVSAPVVAEVVVADDAVVVCNGGPAPDDTESEDRDDDEAGAGASVGEKKKRSTSLAVLKKRLKRNMAAIDKNTAEFKANRVAAVILKAERKAMLEEEKTKKANQKPKKANQKPKKANQKPKNDNKNA
jgi:hypothetical protein